MKKKVVLWSLLGLVVGFAMGSILDFPPGIHDFIKGDVGQARRFKKEVVTPQSQLILQKLQADTALCAQTRASLALIAARTGDFQANARLAQEACEGVEALQEIKKQMEEVQVFAQNASDNAAVALIGLNAALQGDAVDLEGSLNKAFLSYSLLGKKAPLAQNYVAAVDQYLSGKKAADYSALAFSRDRWAVYGTVGAFLARDAAAFQQWAEKAALLIGQEAGQVYESLDPQLKLMFFMNDMAIADVLGAIRSSEVSALHGMNISEPRWACEAQEILSAARLIIEDQENMALGSRHAFFNNAQYILENNGVNFQSKEMPLSAQAIESLGNHIQIQWGNHFFTAMANQIQVPLEDVFKGQLGVIILNDQFKPLMFDQIQADLSHSWGMTDAQIQADLSALFDAGMGVFVNDNGFSYR